jgi:nucleotide-binding universal stress UspA family protein
MTTRTAKRVTVKRSPAPNATAVRRLVRESGSILLATNGSAEAGAALLFSAALAAREQALLRVLTVLEPLPALPAQAAGAAYQTGYELERGEQILNSVRAELAVLPSTPRSLTTMLVGAPGPSIANAAQEWRSDLIVLGAGRHGAVERFLSGDNVVRVLRHARVPVITVPTGHSALPRDGIVAIDFGAASLAAAKVAASLLGGGNLQLVHVRPEIDIPPTDPSGWSALYEAGANTLLTKLGDELRVDYPGLRVTNRLLKGHTATVLLDLIGRSGADLVAVGQHGHGVVDRLLFGSVAQAMVRSAPCAVLVTPAQDAEK